MSILIFFFLFSLFRFFGVVFLEYLWFLAEVVWFVLGESLRCSGGVVDDGRSALAVDLMGVSEGMGEGEVLGGVYWGGGFELFEVSSSPSSSKDK